MNDARPANHSGEAHLRPPLALVTAVAAVLFVFFYPRLIVHFLDEGNPWASYLYQYGMGLVVFIIGLLVILRSGACRPGRGRDGFWLGVLLAGFIFFAVLHAVWIITALKIPFRGEGGF